MNNDSYFGTLFRFRTSYRNVLRWLCSTNQEQSNNIILRHGLRKASVTKRSIIYAVDNHVLHTYDDELFCKERNTEEAPIVPLDKEARI